MRLHCGFFNVLAIAASAQAAAAPTLKSPIVPALKVRATPAPLNSSSLEACALASSASSAYAAENPSETQIVIPAEIAYDCLTSIPNYHEPAVDLINALHSWLEFQSDKGTYLKNPPPGYLFPGVDLEKSILDIKSNVEKGAYNSEYDFQIDIAALLISAKDGHLTWNGDTTGIFIFNRPGIALASVSVDGQQLPQIYVIHDLIHPIDQGTRLAPTTGYAPSPVTAIDGVDALTFLLTQSLVGLSQDPDALYNQVFFQLATEIMEVPSIFEFPTFYPGPYTNITFANGTTQSYPNVAIVLQDLEGISTGDDMYSSFCLYPTATSTSAAATSSSVPSYTSAAPPPLSPPTLPFYPWPVIKHSDNVVAGYYLNDTGFDDVAVLAINSFEPTDADRELEFQQVIQEFLAAAVQSGKNKLVIDLQGNGGGFIDLGLDTFAQFFPSMKPNVRSNMRASIGMNLLSQTLSQLTSQDVRNNSAYEYDLLTDAPFAYQSVMTPDAENFPNFHSFYGPVYNYGGHFTQLFQNNYSDISQSDPFGTGIVITGTNNRTGFPQPFAANDIILLHDGYCASTCTLFSEFMKNYAGVQSIAVGGRPQVGPMQGIGGIKGAQIFRFQDFPAWVSTFWSQDNKLLSQVNGTIFENFTDLPYLRSVQSNPGGVNGRNNIRWGDDSLTPLQYVYEASDCRLWWTQEMLYDPVFLWERVAAIAFQNRTGTQFSSSYCVEDSTGHQTSISGGWKQGTLGPQNPPENARSTVKGWVVDGGLIGGSPAVENITESGFDNQTFYSDSTYNGGNFSNNTSGSDSTAHGIAEACKGYTGEKWLIKAICAAFST